MFPLIFAWKKNGRVNYREAGDLRRHGVHYDNTKVYFHKSYVVDETWEFIRDFPPFSYFLSFSELPEHFQHIECHIQISKHLKGQLCKIKNMDNREKTNELQ